MIRTSVTFDSHAKEVFLSEENHLLENDPHKLLNEMQRREALYPGLYVLKRNAFIAIGQSIERYCLTTASVLNPNRGKNRTNFLRVFHDKDCHYYDAFFRYCCQKCFGVARDGNHCALFLPPSLDEYDHLLMRMRKAMGWFSSYDKESQAALSDLL